MINDIRFLIIYFFLSCALSYVIFPLNYYSYNLSPTDTPEKTINKLYDSGLYILLNIGEGQTEIKAKLISSRTELMIGGNGAKNSKYDEFKSRSYNCTYCAVKDYETGEYFEGVVSTETFYVKNDNNKNLKIDKMKFVLGKRCFYVNPPEGAVGVHLQSFYLDKDYNIIFSLKQAALINSYNWYLDFDNLDKGGAKMIVDHFPHDLHNQKYNASNFKIVNAITSIKGNSNIIWGIQFQNILYGQEKLNLDSESQDIANILVDFNLISAPEVVGQYFEEHFFKEFLSKNICFKKNLGNEYFIYCNNVKEFDRTKFQNLIFKSNNLDVTFRLNYNDVFYVKDNYIYFLILFKANIWNFGKIFLQKYYLVFNQDAKTIGYYKDNQVDQVNQPIEESERNNLFIYILLSLLIISIIGVGILFYVHIKKRPKKKANELDDEYEYKTSKINDEVDNSNDLGTNN
jgi:hypothetical protein